VNLYRRDNEILEEFQAMGMGVGAEDAELAEALLHLYARQEPDNALRRRVLSIPDEDARTNFPSQQEVKGQMNAYRPDNGRFAAGRFALVLVILLILIAVLVTSIPATRTLAMQAIAGIRQSLGIGMQGSVDGFVTFTPGFPFNAKQPGYLPEGFRRTSIKQAPFTSESGAIEALAEEVIVSGGEPSPLSSPGAVSGEALSQRVAVYETELPHVIFTYEATPDHYILLFERAAQPDETLPAGEARTVNGQPATLQKEGDVLILNWIEDGTWLTLESTTAEDQLLQTAESMVTTQSSSEADQLLLPLLNDTTADYPLCNPEEQPTRDAYLEGRKTAGQQRWGSVVIHLPGPDLPVAVGYSTDIEIMPEELFQRVFTALQNPAVPLQPIDYASRIFFVLSEEKACLESRTETPGYIDFVIDVWDEQVSINVGGEGVAGKGDDELRALAIEVLEQELERIAP
jgi:hypothetical protein